MKKHLFEVLNLFGSPGYLNDAKATPTFLLGPAVLNGPTNFYNLSKCVPSPDGIGNKGSGCASWGFQPFCLAI